MSDLDNPIWSSLSTRHSAVSLGGELCRRYEPDAAPFAGLLESTPVASELLLDLVRQGEQVGMIGMHPASQKGWEPIKSFDLAQFVFDGAVPTSESDEGVVLLGQEHLDQMLELTSLVYPAYFRRGTARLGDYFGIFRDGRLAAMAGIRMSFPGYQEISAVCTHPDDRGQGHATRLLRSLTQHILQSGDVPFLHTEADNVAAQGIYRRAGFSVRTMLPFVVLERL